ncbi:Type IV secretion system protein virB1 [uncultured bacterium]|nr:Type IV secretion system protein virB1 [uncultured bacterium]
MVIIPLLTFLNFAQSCAPTVPPVTMAAIVKTESNFNPLAIGVNDKSKKITQPNSVAEAISLANNLISSGYSIDLGLGQINSKNLPRLNLTVENIFDPCTNLKAVNAIFQENYATYFPQSNSHSEALVKTLSAYNTGSPTKGVKNGYVQRVISNSSFNPNPLPISVPVPASLPTTTIPTPAPTSEEPKREEPKPTILVYEDDAKSSDSVLVY